MRDVRVILGKMEKAYRDAMSDGRMAPLEAIMEGDVPRLLTAVRAMLGECEKRRVPSVDAIEDDGHRRWGAGCNYALWRIERAAYHALDPEDGGSQCQD